MQNVLVTGGLGFIGSHLAQILALKKRCKIVVVDNNSDTTRIDDKSTFVYKTNILQKTVLSDIIRREKIDTCVHLAAKIKSSYTAIDLQKTVSTNVTGTLNILQACSEHKVKNFVFASTAAVYGECGSAPLKENHVLQPLSVYGASKAAGEALVAAFTNARKINNGISLRFFNVYGKGHGMTYAGVISQFASRLSRGLPPIIYGTGAQTRDFIFVDDVVKAILKAAAVNDMRGTVNIGTGKPTSISALAQKMIKLFDLDVEPVHCDKQEIEIVHSCANIAKAKDLFHFTPCKDLNSGLRELEFGKG